MKATKFEQANRIFTKPTGMSDDECISLPAFSDETHLISRWRPSFKERIVILFGGKVWLWIAGQSQPPVALETKFPFRKEAADGLSPAFLHRGISTRRIREIL